MKTLLQLFVIVGMLFFSRPVSAQQTWQTGYSNLMWSPRGEKLAFQDNRTLSKTTHIMLANSDGSNIIQLTQGSYNDRLHSWSPDGSKIAFIRFNEGRSEHWKGIVIDTSGAIIYETDWMKDYIVPSTWEDSSQGIVFQITGQQTMYIHKYGLTALFVDWEARTSRSIFINKSIVQWNKATGAIMAMDYGNESTPLSYYKIDATGKHATDLVTLPRDKYLFPTCSMSPKKDMTACISDLYEDRVVVLSIVQGWKPIYETYIQNVKEVIYLKEKTFPTGALRYTGFAPKWSFNGSSIMLKAERLCSVRDLKNLIVDCESKTSPNPLTVIDISKGVAKVFYLHYSSAVWHPSGAILIDDNTLLSMDGTTTKFPAFR